MIYLASPYSGDKERNYQRICLVLKYLFENFPDDVFYSPIAQWHPIATAHGMQNDFKAFERLSINGVNKCRAFVYCAMPGCKESIGMYEELKEAQKALAPRKISIAIPDFKYATEDINSEFVLDIVQIKSPILADFAQLP